MADSPELAALWDRLFSKVAFPSDVLVECWEWRGAYSKKRRGYRPNLRMGRSFINPARLICSWYHGDAPSPAHEAGHTCPLGENSRCVNPRHLQWMSRTENEHYKRAA